MCKMFKTFSYLIGKKKKKKGEFIKTLFKKITSTHVMCMTSPDVTGAHSSRLKIVFTAQKATDLPCHGCQALAIAISLSKHLGKRNK